MATLSFEEAAGLTPPKETVTFEDAIKPAAVSFEEAVGEDEWETGYVLPLARNKRTGEVSLAVPGLIKSAVTLPGDVFTGAVPVAEVDPVTGQVRSGSKAIERAQEFAGLVASGTLARGIATRAGKTADPEIAPATPEAAPIAEPPPVTSPAPVAMPPAFRQMAEAEGIAATQDTAKAGNINLERIAAPEDVKQVIRDTATANAEFVTERRGVISQDQTAEMATLLGMTPEKLSKRKIGQAFNAEEILAARNLLVEQATKVRTLNRAARGGSDADKAALLGEVSKLVGIQSQVAGVTAEAGRALQIFRRMAGAQTDELARIVDEAKTTGKLDDLIEGIHRLDNEPIENVAKFVGDAYRAKTSDKLLEGWINALLSGPQTHATNVLSNTLFSLWSIPEAAVAAGISKVTGSGIRFGEAGARAFGFLEGAKDGIRIAARTFRTEEPTGTASKIEARKYQAIGGKTGKIVRIPGRLLMAEDEFFKSIGYRQEINALAYRQAANEGLKGQAFSKRVAELRANPTEEMQSAARATSEEQTFTKPLGKHGQAFQAWVASHPAARVIVPFIRTPVNIVKEAAQRAPFGILFKETRANLAGKNGAVARDKQWAKLALGSSVGAATVYLALEGAITGQGPKDPRSRALLYRDGWQPYSLKVGDQYYSFSRIEPMGMLLGVSADFAELSKSMSDGERKGIAALIMGSIAKNLTSKTFLKGLSEAIEAYQDPDRYGQRWLQNLTGTVIPTGIAQVARTNDPFLREARTTLDQIRSRIPGLREKLPPRRDVFGEPIKLEGSAGPDILSPIYTSTAKNDPIIGEMVRLKTSPSPPSREIRGVELEPQEYEALQIVTGKAARSLLTTIIGSEVWNKLPDETKSDVIDNALRRARDIGRATVMQQFPDLVLRIAQQKRKNLNAIQLQ